MAPGFSCPECGGVGSAPTHHPECPRATRAAHMRGLTSLLEGALDLSYDGQLHRIEFYRSGAGIAISCDADTWSVHLQQRIDLPLLLQLLVAHSEGLGVTA